LFIRGIAEMLSLVELGAQALVEEAAEEQDGPDREERESTLHGSLRAWHPLPAYIAFLLCAVNPAARVSC
jgi:hypothetical protein